MFLHTIVVSIEHELEAVEALFTSGKAQAAIQEAGTLVSIALPIVQSIDSLAPNKTTEQVIAAAQKLLGSAQNIQPILNEAQTNPAGALLALASTVLQKNLPPAKSGTALNILNTAVQLAVTATHA